MKFVGVVFMQNATQTIVQVTDAVISDMLHCVFFMFEFAVRAMSPIAIGMHVTTGLIVASVLDLRVKSVTSNV